MSLNASRDSAFRILHAASRYEIKERKSRRSTTKDILTNRLFILLGVFPFVIALVLAALARILGEIWLREASLVVLLISYTGVILHPLISLWIQRRTAIVSMKHPFGMLLQNCKDNAAVDLRYLPRLQSKPLEVLEIVALEVKAEREYFERRISLVVGAIDKIGLGPGLLAAFLSLHQMPSNVSQWIVPLAYAIPGLYFLGAMAHFLAMRLDRMSKLLELVITRKKSAPAAFAKPRKVRVVTSARAAKIARRAQN